MPFIPVRSKDWDQRLRSHRPYPNHQDFRYHRNVKCHYPQRTTSPFPCLRSFPTWLKKKTHFEAMHALQSQERSGLSGEGLSKYPARIFTEMSSLPFPWIMQPSQTWLAEQVTTWHLSDCFADPTRRSRGSQKVDFIKVGVSWHCTALHLEQMVIAHREVRITNMAYRSKLN